MKERRTRTVAVKIAGKASENWNRIFGTEAEIAERRAQAIDAQKRGELEVTEQAARNGMAVIQDTLKPYWCPALGQVVRTRGQIRRVFAAAKARGVSLEAGR